MDEFLSIFTNIFTNFGVKTFIVVFITIILVNLIKKPIVKKATEYAEKNDCDKSIITCYITYIAIAITFVINLIYELIVANFNFAIIDWSNYVYTSLTYSAIAIATFEAIKKQIQAYTAKKELSQKSNDTNTEQANSTESSTKSTQNNKSIL